MTTGGFKVAHRLTPTRVAGTARWAWAYFLSGSRRRLQTALGALWLFDGILQLQPPMYSKEFVHQLLLNAVGQPLWVHNSIVWAAHLARGDLQVYNTLFGATQCAIGIGLLYRRTVQPALVLSFAWALVVWYFGEGLGMLLTRTAMPLTGAPGAVSLYALIGLIAWPNGRPGGLVGVRGARIAWVVLWLLAAWLWLRGPSSSVNGVAGAIRAAPSGIGWLARLQHAFATVASGNGQVIALIMAAVSAVVGVAVGYNWHPRRFLAAAAAVNIVYWIVGQGAGGIFQGGATDLNAGPLFMLLAYAMYTLTPPY